MKKFVFKIAVLALITFLYDGCKKPETYSIIPAIQFESLLTEKSQSGKDSLSIITISFTDGDGDIGYLPAGNGYPYDDTLSVYYHNFVVAFFEKKNGVWAKDTTYDHYPYPGFSGRLPNLTPTGTNKTLTGTISMNQYIQFFPVRNDTIHYEVYIYDRALHQSNTITTSDIVISTY